MARSSCQSRKLRWHECRINRSARQKGKLMSESMLQQSEASIKQETDSKTGFEAKTGQGLADQMDIREDPERPEQTSPMFQGPGAVIEGDVRFGQDVSVWHNAVIRTESAPITIGDRSNVQDGCVIHTDPGYPVRIGKNVTIGHGAIVHGATIEDDCLIGMGAILLNGCHIKKGSLIGAGSLVGEGKTIEEKSLVVGLPGKVIRTLDEKAVESNRQNAAHYVEEAAKRTAGTN